MKKFRLLLLDANIVIEISRLGLWAKVGERCEVHLSQVLIDEAQFYEDSNGTRQYIDLTELIDAQSITVFSRTPSEMQNFRDLFDVSYVEKLDPGETESLSYLLDQSEECLFCSADKIVFRVLGGLRRAEQGISLDEVLSKIGVGRPMLQEFTRAYRVEWTKRGFQEGLQGLGIKRSS